MKVHEGRCGPTFTTDLACLETAVCQQFRLYCIISIFAVERVFSVKDSEKLAQYYRKIKK